MLYSEGFEAKDLNIRGGEHLEVKFRGVWDFKKSSLWRGGGTDKKWNDPHRHPCETAAVPTEITP